MELADLLDIESIQRLKHRYVRCVDLGLHDELGECLTSDAVAAYDEGRYSFEGRDAIVEFLRTSTAPTVVSMHIARHPEIDLTSPTAAVGSWAFEASIFNTATGMQLHSAGYYHDTYAKIDGEWKIASTGYALLFEHRSAVIGRPVPR